MSTLSIEKPPFHVHSHLLEKVGAFVLGRPTLSEEDKARIAAIKKMPIEDIDLRLRELEQVGNNYPKKIPSVLRDELTTAAKRLLELRAPQGTLTATELAHVGNAATLAHQPELLERALHDSEEYADGFGFATTRKALQLALEANQDFPNALKQVSREAYQETITHPDDNHIPLEPEYHGLLYETQAETGRPITTHSLPKSTPPPLYRDEIV